MADFERRELEIGLEFGRLSFTKLNNFSKGSSEPKKGAQVIRGRGRQPHKFFNSNYLFSFILNSNNEYIFQKRCNLSVNLLTSSNHHFLELATFF